MDAFHIACLRKAACGALLVLLGQGSSVFGQPVLIDRSAVIISPGTTSIVDQPTGTSVPLATAQITVQGQTLTINGRHTIASLVVQRGITNIAGVVTHTANYSYDYSGGAGTDIVRGMELTTTGPITIQGAADPLVASRIDCDSRGYPQRQGPGSISYSGGGGGGGGSHGGAGGNGSGVIGGACNDSFEVPTDFGSGGTGTCCAASGAGGGRVSLVVGGTLTIDGVVTANGQSSGAGTLGGGAGGSIHVSAPSIVGSGTVSAKGGTGEVGSWGAGGGGRIAAYYGTATFALANADASGGAVGYANIRGGAGTVYLKPNTGTATLIIDNKATVAGETTEFAGASTITGDLVVRGAAVIGPAPMDDSMSLTVTGNATLMADSGFFADGRGYPQRQGPGTVNFNGGGGGGGAGHGGAGSNGTGVVGGDCYGSITAPTTMGSGGTGSCCGSSGPGGGVVRLTVNGTLTVDGFMSADGSAPGATLGGGAGGSIWITAGTLSGSGVIRARGASGDATGWGAGGGGRIAVYYSTLALPAANFDASGGTVGAGGVRGGAGTVYLKPNSGIGTLIIDNKATTTGEATEMTGEVNIDAALLVRGGGYLGPKHGDDSMHLILSGGATIDADGKIGADFRGFAQRQGPGTLSHTGGGGGSGAGHGGAGANGSGFGGGDCYGSVTSPVTMGSGGSGSCCSSAGRGGGALRLTMAGAMVVNGSLSSNGEGLTGTQAGGGAGGSIWVACGALSGSGSIEARGGSGDAASWGGGGGGRVAMYCASTTFPQENYNLSGGTPSYLNVQGGAGTLFVKPGTARGTIFIDNNASITGEATEFSGTQSFDANLTVANGGYLAPKHQDDTLELTLSGSVNVAPMGKIGADFRGYPVRGGPGTSVHAGGGGGAGAGHGGAGANGSGKSGGDCYGSITQPTTMGSGGTANCCATAGRGGGRVRITIAGDLTVNGGISANGEGLSSSNGGGGAGGSLWIACGVLSGSGSIEARGGSGDAASWGGGGGGRVAVYYTSSVFPVANFNLSGGAPSYGGIGGAGTLYLKPAGRGTIYVDNEGTAGEYTEMTGEVAMDANLVVDNGGVVGPKHLDGSLHLNLGGDITVGPAGRLGADKRGYPRGQGPGSFNYTGGGGGGGGGYGGRGGNGSGGTGGPTYGSTDKPTDMGSGGGGSCCAGGGAGGGRLQITTPGVMTVNGFVSANGESGSPGNGGGGAGGSVWITAGSLAGSGSVQGNGGAGADTASWGGGGGGRVAVYCCNITLPAGNITATGGTGVHPGGAGTVFYGTSTVTITLQPQNVTVGDGDTAMMTAAGATAQPSGTVTYQWRRQEETGAFVPLSNGPRYGGVTTNTLSIFNVICSDNGQYDVLVSDSCGAFPSRTATVHVFTLSDIVGIGGDPPADGRLTGDDFVAFINAFAAEDLLADVTGIGGPPEVPDGLITGDDFNAFISDFATGCP